MPAQFTFLGTGTSQGIPVVGCDCAVCASPDPRDTRLRSSALVRDADTTLLIDCGPDARVQLLAAGVRQLDAVVITHEHNDHIIGLDDLRPLIFKQRAPVRLYAEPRVQASIRERFAYAFAEHPYPGAPRFELLDLAPGERLQVGTLPAVEPLRIMHGELPILGFRIGGLAYLTDVKTVPAATRARLADVDTLVTSSLHHHAHHSHMNLPETLAFVEEVGAPRTYLIHMSHLMGLHAAGQQVLPQGVAYAYDGLSLELPV